MQYFGLMDVGQLQKILNPILEKEIKNWNELDDKWITQANLHEEGDYPLMQSCFIITCNLQNQQK